MALQPLPPGASRPQDNRGTGALPAVCRCLSPSPAVWLVNLRLELGTRLDLPAGICLRPLGGVAKKLEEAAQLEGVDQLFCLQLGVTLAVNEGVSHQRFAPQVADRLSGTQHRLQLRGYLRQV